MLGGTGNKVGAVLGGAIVAYVPLRFTAIAEYKYLIFGVVLVILMIWRAQGLLPARMQLLTFGREAYARMRKANADRAAGSTVAKEGSA